MCVCIYRIHIYIYIFLFPTLEKHTRCLKDTNSVQIHFSQLLLNYDVMWLSIKVGDIFEGDDFRLILFEGSFSVTI